jgi:MFS family permease
LIYIRWHALTSYIAINRESQDDPDMPMNFPQWRKWLLVVMTSTVTVIPPLAASILSPGIASLSKEFHNDNIIVASMMVSIYLLGYVIGPLFLAPLAELYGRRVVLCAANVFFCVWQIGCALAPNIASLIGRVPHIEQQRGLD